MSFSLRLFFDVNSHWCTTPNNVTCDSRTTNAPNRRPLIPIDLSKCQWFGNIFGNGTYVKSICHVARGQLHAEAVDNCHIFGMRLLRIEDSAVQTATVAYIHTRIGVGSGGIYHVGGSKRNSIWYHDDNTSVYENMRWKNGMRPALDNLAFNNANPWFFESYPTTKILNSICEFNHISHFN